MLATEITGNGRPVVLLHAFPLSRGMWRQQHEGLSGHCRLITPDLPGFGDSPVPHDSPSIEGMADAVVATLDSLSLTAVVLGGLSMGGYVAMAFARKYPQRLAGLILADTRSEADDDAARANRDRLIALVQQNPVSTLVEQMLPKLLGATTQDSRPEVVAVVRRLAALQSPAGIIAALAALRDRPDATTVLPTIKVPTLILVGDQDQITPLEMADRMAAAIPGSRRVLLPNAGHLSNMEQPTLFNDALREFLFSMTS